MIEILSAIIGTVKMLVIDWTNVIASQAIDLLDNLSTLQKILAGIAAIISGIFVLIAFWWRDR